MRAGRTFVVDSSVVLKWRLPEADSALAESLLEKVLFAPDLLLAECANALWKLVRRGDIAAADAVTALADLKKAPVNLMRDGDLVEDAQHLSLSLDHPIYDCLYLALGMRCGVPVVTADERFVRRVEQRPDLAGAVIRLSFLADLA